VSRETHVDQTTPSPRTSPALRSPVGLGPLNVLVLFLWCGLTAGLLEAGTRVLCRAIDPTARLYMMSRHFVWLTPLANMALCLGVGLCPAAITTLWPRQGGWLSVRLAVAMAITPTLIVTVPLIFPEAWFVLALGIACQAAPWVERHSTALRRWLVWSFPGLLALVLILAGSFFVGDWLKERREAARALPPADSPNVVFIVLDTVRADRLSLYGYERPTTPTLERLAKRGFRFDSARATAPWTLASHASMFTGRLPHELEVEWLTPLRKNFPLLAEYLGSHGYATAGFVSNAQYCSYDTGLSRGFTYYEDYPLKNLSFLRTSIIVEETLKSVILLGVRQDSGPLYSLQEYLARLFNFGIRRDAGSINRGFLDWLDHRRNPRRPFFVFFNFLDAHTPYELPPGAQHHFGRKPQTQNELRIIYDSWPFIDKLQLPRHYLTLARDSYDNCLAYLDGQLGELIDDLQKRGVLEKTWVVITADHGEGLGEHDLFGHGESLYSTEIRVPLLIVPPPGTQAASVVRETVSLRDLPATIVDVVGMGTGAPFPGRSLLSLWRDPPSAAGKDVLGSAISELPSPNPSDPSHGRSPGRRGPLIALADGHFVYIRNEGDGTEELYDERDDPRELTNRARGTAMRSVLEQLRDRLAWLKASPSGAADKGD
jgi:arylsulfatase A-like enzyme